MTDTPPEIDGTRRFLGNAAWLLTGEAVGKVASFVFFVIVARGLGTVDYGYFNFAIAFFPLFLMVSTWGLEIALVREIARHKERVSELFASGLIVRIGLGIAACIAAIALIPLFTDGSAPLTAVTLVGAALLVDQVASFLGSAFKAFERMAGHAVILMVNRVASTALAGAVFFSGGGLIAIATVYLIGSCLALGTGWVALKRLLPPIRLRHATGATIRELLHIGTPLALGSALNTAVFRVDTVLLQAIKGPAAVAMYGVGYRFFESFLFIGWSLAAVALPRLSRQDAGPSAFRTIQQTLALDLAFYLPIAAGAPFVSGWAVTAIFSDQYAPAARVVPWLTAAAALYAVAHLFRHAVIAIGHRRAVPWVAGATLAICLTGNAFAIPRYGFVGAGVVTFVTEAFEALILASLFFRWNGIGRLERVVIVPVLAAAAMAAALLVFDLDGPGALVGGSLVYVVALALGAAVLAADGVRSVIGVLRPRSSSIEPVPDETSDV